MPSPLPPCLKPIQGYLLRADEVEPRDPIVAYYARMYALNRAVAEKLADRNSPGMPVLLQLMDRLEKDKVKLAGEEAMSNNLLAHAHVENFVLSIFNYADNEDRAGRITKKIARCFLMAYQLFDTLKAFEPELNPDIEEKMRYAKVKAAYITRCLRTGDTPQAGPLVASADDNNPTNAGPGAPPELGTPPRVESPPGFEMAAPSAVTSTAISEQEAFARRLQQEEYDAAAQREIQRQKDAQLQQELQQQQMQHLQQHQQQQQQFEQQQHQQLQQQQQQQQQYEQQQQQQYEQQQQQQFEQQRLQQQRELEAHMMQQKIDMEQQRMATQQKFATMRVKPQATPAVNGLVAPLGSKRVNPTPSGDAAAKAAKAIKFAASAINFDDYETTVKYLTEAYELLTI